MGGNSFTDGFSVAGLKLWVHAKIINAIAPVRTIKVIAVSGSSAFMLMTALWAEQCLSNYPWLHAVTRSQTLSSMAHLMVPKVMLDPSGLCLHGGPSLSVLIWPFPPHIFLPLIFALRERKWLCKRIIARHGRQKKVHNIQSLKLFLQGFFRLIWVFFSSKK